ncbi:MAG: hypothetical protein HDT22_05025, partial [Ruminococcus sp.]|nr:hypothetical protein [Ruminococcus sp.]
IAICSIEKTAFLFFEFVITLIITDSGGFFYLFFFELTLKLAVNNPDYRDDTVEKIHKLWKQHRINIHCKVLEDTRLRNDELHKINQRLKFILESLDRNKIYALQRMNEGVIDTFYNMLISSRIIAETEDELKVIYDYQSEKTVTEMITNISMNPLFYQQIEWEEFKIMIDIKNFNLENEELILMWSLLLSKENVTADDIKSMDKYSYNFAKKYVKTIAEYWVSESHDRNYVILYEWIIVMQELMCIYKNKVEYQNRFIRHINPKVKLTAAVKNFDKTSRLPHLIILNRLTHHMLLTFGTKKLFEEKLQAEKYVMEIEKIIFSYKNIEDIQVAHNYLFLRVTAALTTDLECSDILYVINSRINIKLCVNNINPISLVHDNNANLDFLIHILAKDRTYRLTKNKDFMKLVQKWLSNSQNLLNLLEEHRSINFSVNAIDIIIEKFAKEIESVYIKNMINENDCFSSQIFQIPIYFGENNEYNCHIQFILQNNIILISQLGIIGNNIESYDSYNQLMLY